MAGLLAIKPEELQRIAARSTWAIGPNGAVDDAAVTPTPATPRFPPNNRLAMLGLGDEGPPDNQAPRTRLALDPFTRMLIPSEMETRAQQAIRSLTDNALDEGQVKAIYREIIRNIEIDDAKKFGSINTNRRPVILDPDQHKVVTEQLNLLSPKLGEIAIPAFENAIRSGRVGLSE